MNTKRRADQILDTYAHPMSGPSVVNWLLDIWFEHPDIPLIVLTVRGDGERLIRRTRVTISQARKKLKHKARRFTMRTSVIDWDYGNGLTVDAVTFEREVANRHIAAEVFDEIFGGRDGR